jgi:hypothetical protein
VAIVALAAEVEMFSEMLVDQVDLKLMVAMEDTDQILKGQTYLKWQPGDERRSQEMREGGYYNKLLNLSLIYNECSYYYKHLKI